MIRLMRSVAVCAAVGVAALGCKHSPSAKEKNESQIHYDLAVNAQEAGDKQEAFKELSFSLSLDPTFPEAQFAMGLLLQAGFNRLDEAVTHYREAIALRPGYSEAKTNLGTVYVAQGKYDDAIALFREALNDMAYATPHIAQGNLGWALYKKGEKARAINEIKSAVTTRPQFCLGYMWLAEIYEADGDAAGACKQNGRYREECPDQANAYYREGLCLAKAGDTSTALERFGTCQEKASGELREDCGKLKEQLEGRP